MLPHGVRVHFQGYGNIEDVPIQYLRPLSASVTKKKEGHTVQGNDKGLIPIPDKLKVLPTDTEEVDELNICITNIS